MVFCKVLNCDEIQFATFSFVDCAFGVKSKAGFELRPSGCGVHPLNHNTPDRVEPFLDLFLLRHIPFLPSLENTIILKLV